jgi:Na+/proline symporter
MASFPDFDGDWGIDASPAVQALAGGHVGAYLSADAMMGTFATLVQAPFVALSDTTGLDAYRWACFPCLLAAGLLGLYLAAIARRRGASRLTQGILAILCLVNPLTFEALESGHPEEILTAALVVAAVATACENRPWHTAVLIGLAVASKQWAVIGVLPALMALPSHRLRSAICAAAVASLLILPAVVADPGSFLGVQGEAAGTGNVVTPWSVWYPLSESSTKIYSVGGERLVAHLKEAPTLVGSLSHPLIVVLAVALPLALALRRGKLPLSPSDAMAVLALVALVRCMLDPVDNFYYHLPLLLALLGWDALTSRGLPLRTLIGATAALLFWPSLQKLSDPVAFNAAYLAVMGCVGFALASSLFVPLPGRAYQETDFSVD